MGNERPLPGLQTGCWPKFGSYGKYRIFWPKSRFWARLILGPKSRFLAKKSDFCHTTPILVSGTFVALGESYGRFRKKKNSWCVKKSSPYPLWGHCPPVTALALSTRKPIEPAPLGLEWISHNFLKFSITENSNSCRIFNFFLNFFKTTEGLIQRSNFCPQMPKK